MWGGKNQDPVSLSLYHAHTHIYTHALFPVWMLFVQRPALFVSAGQSSVWYHTTTPALCRWIRISKHTHTIPLLSTLIFHQITCPAFLASRYNPNADPTGRKKAARPIKSKRVLKKNTPFQTFSFLRQKRSGESVAPCSALTSLCWLR